MLGRKSKAQPPAAPQAPDQQSDQSSGQRKSRFMFQLGTVLLGIAPVAVIIGFILWKLMHKLELAIQIGGLGFLAFTASMVLNILVAFPDIPDKPDTADPQNPGHHMADQFDSHWTREEEGLRVSLKRAQFAGRIGLALFAATVLSPFSRFLTSAVLADWAFYCFGGLALLALNFGLIAGNRGQAMHVLQNGPASDRSAADSFGPPDYHYTSGQHTPGGQFGPGSQFGPAMPPPALPQGFIPAQTPAPDARRGNRRHR